MRRALDRFGGRADTKALVAGARRALAADDVTDGHLFRHGLVRRRRVAAVDERRSVAFHR